MTTYFSSSVTFVYKDQHSFQILSLLNRERSLGKWPPRAFSPAHALERRSERCSPGCSRKRRADRQSRGCGTSRYVLLKKVPYLQDVPIKDALTPEWCCGGIQLQCQHSSRLGQRNHQFKAKTRKDDLATLALNLVLHKQMVLQKLALQ